LFSNIQGPQGSPDNSNLSIGRSDHYALIAMFSILGGSLLMSSLDLLSMYLSIELQSFGLYILATLNKDKLSSASSGLKYFLLGSLSSTFILLGAGIIYSYTGLTHLESINALMSVCLSNNTVQSAIMPLNSGLSNTDNIILGLDITQAFSIGLVLILVGFLFKISAAPFYQ
jgi:NADH-ubiquinone oxidoreductase chain 2